MKITRTRLRRLINEELSRLNEGIDDEPCTPESTEPRCVLLRDVNSHMREVISGARHRSIASVETHPEESGKVQIVVDPEFRDEAISLLEKDSKERNLMYTEGNGFDKIIAQAYVEGSDERD